MAGSMNDNTASVFANLETLGDGLYHICFCADDKHVEDLHDQGHIDHHVREAIRKWPRRKHTVYIESLLEELVKLSFHDKRVVACRVSIFKPDIYNEAAGAGVEVYRVRT